MKKLKYLNDLVNGEFVKTVSFAQENKEFEIHENLSSAISSALAMSDYDDIKLVYVQNFVKDEVIVFHGGDPSKDELEMVYENSCIRMEDSSLRTVYSGEALCVDCTLIEVFNEGLEDSDSILQRSDIEEMVIFCSEDEFKDYVYEFYWDGLPDDITSKDLSDITIEEITEYLEFNMGKYRENISGVERIWIIED